MPGILGANLKLDLLFSTEERRNPVLYSWIGRSRSDCPNNRGGGLRAAVFRAKGSTEGIRRLGSHRHAGRSFFFESSGGPPPVAGRRDRAIVPGGISGDATAAPDPVGPITALTFVLVLEDPAEFGHNRDVGPYLVTPKKHQSGDSDPQLGISKRGNGMLRRLLVQAAHYILGPFAQDSDLRPGRETASRGGKSAKKRAVVRPQARGGAPAVVAQWAGVSTLVQRAAAGGRLGLSASTPGELIRRLKKESF